MNRKTIEFSQITTRGGDQGESSLFNGERRAKDDPIFDLLGDLDELASFLGLSIAGLREKNGEAWINVMDEVQGKLIIIGGMVANPDNRSRLKLKDLQEKDVLPLEKYQKELMENVTLPRAFIHPGKTMESAYIDVARTICRRCERKIVRCIRKEVMTQLIPCQVYLNRLSDLLFVSARYWEQNLS